MGPDGDVILYDLMAQRVLAGDSQYHTMFDVNFPGIVWLHAVIRSLFGWRSEVLRAVDLAIVAAIVSLLVGWLPRSVSTLGRIGVAAALAALYLSTSEWCHCQRDVWMLLPSLVALRFRCRQTERLGGPQPTTRVFARAVAEGAVWAVAVWIKPYVVVPAFVAWLVSVRQAVRVIGCGRRLAADLAGLLIGGLTVGGLGVAWLAASGAWPSFVEVMFVWNREYFAFNTGGDVWWYGPLGLIIRFFPWMLVHFAAVPLALRTLFFGRPGTPVGVKLRAGFYLGWLAQSILLQHVFDYVHVPALLLAVTLLAAEAAARWNGLGGRLIVFLVVLCVVWKGIGLTADRAAAWADCIRSGSTPAVRDRTTLLHRIQWEELHRVSDFLYGQGLHDGELTCFSPTTMSIYNEFGLRPSTRFLFLQQNLLVFISRRDVILTDLANSRQRILVCDLNFPNMQGLRARLDGDDSSPWPLFKDRVLFRAGDYVVFRLSGAEMPEWLALLDP
jgi:hypothetical protein